VLRVTIAISPVRTMRSSSDGGDEHVASIAPLRWRSVLQLASLGACGSGNYTGITRSSASGYGGVSPRGMKADGLAPKSPVTREFSLARP
jgi:hypothetical protein